MALDFATRRFLEMMAQRGRPPLHAGTPVEARLASTAMADLAGPAPPMARVEEHSVTSSDGSVVPMRLLVPIASPRGLIVFYHGGGWVIGSVEQSDTVGRKLAERTSCAVLLVDYRLAPEHRYPAAVEDSYAALLWAEENLQQIAGRKVPLMVAGDSAGGNLAAVVALRARDRKGPDLALQVLIYPVTDADFECASYLDPENQLFLARESMLWFWDHYLPDAKRRLEPDASPLRAASLVGLPPAVVLTAEHDVLRDEGELYAQRLKEAGVAVDFKRHDGQMHGFFTLLPLPGSESGFQQVVKAVRGCLARAELAEKQQGNRTG